MAAFWKLITERMGGNVIPHSKIMEYAEGKGLNSAMSDVLATITWSLEREYAKWLKDKDHRQNFANKPSPAQRAKNNG